MIVICVTDCPAKLRGDLSKWLFEINTGVYVGKLSARVRDRLWLRVCENVKNGRATMVYSADNEQGIRFETHNTTWQPKDFDGLTLMQRPFYQDVDTQALKPGFSKAARYQKARKRQRGSDLWQDYVIIDTETTGLDAEKHQLLELGCIRVQSGHATETYQALILQDKSIPASIVRLTGITDALVRKEGVPLQTALQKMMQIIKGHPVVGYNIRFDCHFLQRACQLCQVDYEIRRFKDIKRLAEKKTGRSREKLETLAKHLGIEKTQTHRALDDCKLTLEVIHKLNKMA